MNDLKSDIRVAKLARGDYKHKVGKIDLTEDDIIRFLLGLTWYNGDLNE